MLLADFCCNKSKLEADVARGNQKKAQRVLY